MANPAPDEELELLVRPLLEDELLEDELLEDELLLEELELLLLPLLDVELLDVELLLVELLLELAFPLDELLDGLPEAGSPGMGSVPVQAESKKFKHRTRQRTRGKLRMGIIQRLG